MFEIKFNNKRNIKKDIKVNKSEKNINKKHTLIMTLILIYTIVGFFVAKKVNTFLILESVPLVCLLGIAYNGIDSLITYIKSERGFKNTCNLVDDLEKLNIKTTANNLLNSVIIEQSKTTIKETQDEEEITEEIKRINDTYYLFLDNDYDIQGLLERDTIISTNDEKTKEKKYFVLEKEEINTLEDRVSKVKKLVKVKK